MSRLNLEWRQFRLLLRSGPGQLLDREMLAPDGDMMAGAANVLALLGSFGLALSLLMLYKYVFGAWHGFAIEDVTWPDKQYLIAAAMLSSGFILVLTWDGLFPDRRETMVVCPLPVHMRTPVRRPPRHHGRDAGSRGGWRATSPALSPSPPS